MTLLYTECIKLFFLMSGGLIGSQQVNIFGNANAAFTFNIKDFARCGMFSLIKTMMKKLRLNVEYTSILMILLLVGGGISAGISLSCLIDPTTVFTLGGGVAFNYVMDYLDGKVEAYLDEKDFEKMYDKIRNISGTIEKLEYRIFELITIMCYNNTSIKLDKTKKKGLKQSLEVIKQCCGSFFSNCKNIDENTENIIVENALKFETEVIEEDVGKSFMLIKPI